MTLRNKRLGRSSYIINKEETDLREQTKNKVEEIEELKEGVDGIEFQSVKTPEDLNFLKHKEAVSIAEIEQKLIRSGILKKLINILKKLIISKKYLHLVSEDQLIKYIMVNYYQ